MKKKNAITAALLAAVMLLSACGAASSANMGTQSEVTEEPETTGTEAVISDVVFSSDGTADDDARVFYEIFVGSFADSNGDGIGDLRGIIDRMDYLNDGDPQSGKSLGVEGLWLTPIFSSRSYHKYDVMDYYSIDESFGTMEDLQELIALCHERDVKIIIDLPINHTSTGCEWFGNFVAAHRSGDTESLWYNWYSWAPSGSTPAGRSFSQISGTSDYYECNFSGDMPELNFDSDDVYEAVLDIARFYLDMGIDGFRFDAAKYIYFGDNETSSAFWYYYLGELREQYPDMYAVAEVWDSDGITDCYYPAVNCFDFTCSGTEGLIAAAAKGGSVSTYTSYVENYINRVTAMNSDALFVPFVSNHDQDRASGSLTVSSGSMQMAANLYILGPGSPFIYYGEEIGIKGSRGSANTDANRRLAMLWGDGDTVADPTGTTYDPTKQTNGTVADQLGDSTSLYNYYKRLIMIRKANPEIASGEYKALSFSGTSVGGFISTLDGSSVCVIHNTTDTAQTIDLSQATSSMFETVAASVGVGECGAELNGTVLTLSAQTSVVLR